ncbi:MAG: hypothetical protein QXJ14_04520 [Candidatus Aenigmatarchaeota archaeon]
MKLRRKKFIVDSRFQFKYTFYYIFFSIFLTIVVFIVIYVTCWFSFIKEFSEVKLHQDLTTIVRLREYEGVRTKTFIETIPILKEEAKMLSDHQLKILNDILKKTNLRILKVLFVIIFLQIFFGIFITHKIAGPLFRINRELNKLIEENLDVNFNIRKKDELQPLSQSLQTLVNKLILNKKQLEIVLDELEKTGLNEKQKEIVQKLKNVL